MLGLVVFMHAQKGNLSPGRQTENSHASRSTIVSSLSRLDYLGNLIFIPSMISLLWGVVMGGNQIPWSSFRVIVPIVLGLLGWSAFHFQQTFLAKYPSVPTRLFTNRTLGLSLPAHLHELYDTASRHILFPNLLPGS